MTNLNSSCPITKVGAIADPDVSDRNLIPFLTLDCRKNPHLEKAIELHRSSQLPGDVTCTWTWTFFRKKKVYLKIDFERPIQATGYIQFDVEKHGYVIEWIRSVHGTYLQSSKFGETVSEGLGSPAVLIEVPHNATFPIWEKLYEKSIRKHLLAQGTPKNKLSPAIEDYKKIRREFWQRFSTGI